ncbi:MAG: hypothetical protein IKB63_02305, partial [Parabacteroides sp.]|nr:hypothetical protein [Parabacteroides sp.]
VNVEHYTVVATGDTQESAKRAYIEKLVQENIIDGETNHTPNDNMKNATITVTDIKMPVIGGNTVVYITDENGTVYKQLLSENESLILVTVGKKYTIEYSDTDIELIKQIYSLPIS